MGDWKSKWAVQAMAASQYKIQCDTEYEEAERALKEAAVKKLSAEKELMDAQAKLSTLDSRSKSTHDMMDVVQVCGYPLFIHP